MFGDQSYSTVSEVLAFFMADLHLSLSTPYDPLSLTWNYLKTKKNTNILYFRILGKKKMYASSLSSKSSHENINGTYIYFLTKHPTFMVLYN